MPGVTSRTVPARLGAAGLEEVAQRLAVRFPRSEPRQRALAYLQGLLSQWSVKNSWQLAEQAGDESPYGVQHLLSRAAWNPDKVRDDLRAYAVEHLGEAEGVLIVDETGFLKKGEQSVGVQRSIRARRAASRTAKQGCFWPTLLRGGHTVLDRALSVPRSWSEDAERGKPPAPPTRDTCRQTHAGSPDDRARFGGGRSCSSGDM